jgi:Amt family ammonium transporter
VGVGGYEIWTVVTCFMAWNIIGSLLGGIRVP